LCLMILHIWLLKNCFLWKNVGFTTLERLISRIFRGNAATARLEGEKRRNNRL